MVVPSNEHVVFSEPIRTVGRETKTANRLLQDFNVNDTTGVPSHGSVIMWPHQRSSDGPSLAVPNVIPVLISQIRLIGPGMAACIYDKTRYAARLNIKNVKS